MLRTYEATLCDGRIEWEGEVPPERGPLRVHVTVLDHPAAANPARGRAMADALAAIAARGGVDGIEDPVAWQRESRQDRPLPSRNE